LDKIEIANNTRPKAEKEPKEDKENARSAVQSAVSSAGVAAVTGATASKKSLHFEKESAAPAPAAPEVLCMNSNDGKEKRTGKDKRGRTISAETVAEAAEQLVSLRDQFGRCASEPMLSRLFSSDFKKVVEGCNALLAQVSESQSGKSAVLECSDLIIKWCVLRLYEGSNSQLVTRVFDVLNSLLDAFEEGSKHLDETEANNLITCLCERVGVNQESIRHGIRTLIKKLPKVVLPSRVYACILDTAVKTKNMRSRSDCLDEMAVLVDAHGVEVAGSLKTLAAVAAFVASSSADVRNSALTLLTSFYLPMGDKVPSPFALVFELAVVVLCAPTHGCRSTSILEHLIAFQRASSPIDLKVSRGMTTSNHQLQMHLLPLPLLLQPLLPLLHPTPRSALPQHALPLLPSRCTDRPPPLLYALPRLCRHRNSLLPPPVSPTVSPPSVSQKSLPLPRVFAIPMRKCA
jgi:hypothetical protein